MKILYKAKATTSGGPEGHVKSDDGVLNMKLSSPKALGGKGGNFTNPEQLFAAGYSASFTGALEEVAKEQKIDLGDFTVSATVGIEKTEEGYLQMSVILDAYIPGMNVETAEELVNDAHEICPYSIATIDNIDVTLNLMLDED
jgi:Ohr subfamily peroxiredoxin